MPAQPFTLDDKYTAESGVVLLSGIQALVRVALDQRRSDVRAGLNTASLISGYRGSPLGGLDLALERAKALLEQHHVHFLRGINEDLAATAVFGAQLANTYPRPRYDGVLGMWYGKGPGVDRTGDIFRHANLAGLGPNGGVLVVAGDDPSAKSSTVPSGSEVALFDLQMPILYPGNVQEILELGLQGYALSRYSGCWTALKIVTNTADAIACVELREERFRIVRPRFSLDPANAGRDWAPTQNAFLLAPSSLDQERDIHEGRLEAARRFAAANGLNRLMTRPAAAWLGIVCAGKTYYDVREALQRLGLDQAAAERLGVRILKLGMLYPLEPTLVREFAQGLQEIVVIEEKRSFIELQLRDCLYGLTTPIIGKRNERGELFVPAHGELEADAIARLLRSRLLLRLPAAQLRPEPPADTERQLRQIALPAAATRTPYFCSGCPHNRSTTVPEQSIANGAVGCSTMALWMDRNTTNIVQMGGEGVQWVGAAPFSDTPHIFQNIGDGTYLHSGSLAIRQAVAAGTRITYKLLYNGAVAMTGGQSHDVPMSVPDIANNLATEGVARIIVVSHDPGAYRAVKLPTLAEVWHRDRAFEAQELLRKLKGVTVMLYDQPCAADLRRKRKRGLVAAPARRVLINEAVCEGCGDCGAKSNCLSVEPVETQLGRKTQIDQSSCNQDFTCVTGNCPSFLLIEPAAGFRPEAAIDAASIDGQALSEPPRRVAHRANILMTGVGGTGVVTINQVLATAAHLDGLRCTGLDQTGLAQKGGSVVSHLKLSLEPLDESNLVGGCQTDVLLAFDIVTAAHDKHIFRNSNERTFAVINSGAAPNGPQVRDVNAAMMPIDLMRRRLSAVTRRESNFCVDASALARAAFGDQMPANFIIVGIAYQAGWLPLTAQAIEQAVTLNGASVRSNIQAFRLGRKFVQDPAWAATLKPPRPGAMPLRPQLSEAVQQLLRSAALPSAVLQVIEPRLAELESYQSLAYAQRYLQFITRVFHAEADQRTALTVSVAKSLFKLMAYKDEYEVARLHLLPEFDAVVSAQFGGGARRRYLLQPPLFARFGLARKMEFGSWVRVVFKALRWARRWRGTPLDVFGFDSLRRQERALADEYSRQIEAILPLIAASDYALLVQLADAADKVRGYDTVKAENIRRWRDESQRLLRAIKSQIAAPSAENIAAAAMTS